MAGRDAPVGLGKAWQSLGSPQRARLSSALLRFFYRVILMGHSVIIATAFLAPYGRGTTQYEYLDARLVLFEPLTANLGLAAQTDISLMDVYKYLLRSSYNENSPRTLMLSRF